MLVRVDIVRVFVIGFLSAMAIACLIVMTVSFIVHPANPLPQLVSTTIAGIFGFCLHYLGWDGAFGIGLKAGFPLPSPATPPTNPAPTPNVPPTAPDPSVPVSGSNT